jgi:predicted ATP-grasp superfamily ATP-dependent carboligase
MGDMDMVRPLALAGIPCAAVAAPGNPVHFSRFTSRTVQGVDQWTQSGELIDRLLDLARSERLPPVLFYQTDGDLLAVSRHRDRLSTAFRFVLPPASLVEDLVDKSRFQQLAASLDLPVPASHLVRPAVDAPDTVTLPFPLIVKPLSRAFPAWFAVEEEAKAIRVDDARALADLWPHLARAEIDVLLQELIPGEESRIESHHAYVDATGDIAAEFTGRKIRTYPPEYGHSTAVQTTRASDVAQLGREVLRRLGYRGVAKVDFKRGADGRLHLLEVNPRFNLWHYVGAVAGVNIPAVVYADLVGAPRPAVGLAREGVTWCRLWPDRSAARAADFPLRRWLPWALRADSWSVIRWDDPLPFVCGRVWPRIASARRALRGTIGG